jgi:hypothetical protein
MTTAIPGHTVEVNAIPQCQFCTDPAGYDGRTNMGPWAFMCQAHWDEHGPGATGVGYGQKLVLRATGFTVVCGRCPLCGERTELEVATAELADAINAWRFAGPNRPYIQDAFPHLTPGQREEILTAMHERCFDSAFAVDEDDDRDEDLDDGQPVWR